MYALDFEYDGRLLSQYGFIICEFDASSGANVADTGYDIQFEKVSRNHGKQHGLVSAEYEDCVTTTFQICKDPEGCDDLRISNDEYRDLARWLNRREFQKFRIVNEYEDDRPACYFNASFNIKKIMIADKLYGLELTAETDSPFGYGVTFDKTWTISKAGGNFELTDMSGDIGYICPEVIVTCKSAGTLTLKNSLYDVSTTLKNCTSGEVIHFYGDTQIIESSRSAHALYDDFNFEFLRAGNTLTTRKNTISSTLPCSIEIKYTPIIKDIP